MGTIDRSEGQRAFGGDPDKYHAARPAYPERVFEILRQRCCLRSCCPTFEIGGGTGLGTRRLMELGASPLVVIEPDQRLASFLTRTLGAVDVRVTMFERSQLPTEGFDLGTAASAFHWLDEPSSLAKIGQILRDGGWWAVWWNLFFDSSRTDDFHQATRTLLACLDRSPSRGLSGKPSFAMDTDARIASLRAAGVFEQIEFEHLRWSVVLGTLQVVQLYSTFSPISRLHFEEQNRLLHQLGQIAEKQFRGKVELYITTQIYTAQRRGRGSPVA
jgi:hypothetical protein